MSARDRHVRRDGLPDLRYGKPAGFVVQGITVETLPVRPQWEAIAEKCAVCAHCLRWDLRLLPHRFHGQDHG